MVITKTSLSGDRAKRIMGSLPFDGAVCIDTIGFAGGIWLLWRSDSDSSGSAVHHRAGNSCSYPS